MTYLKITKEEIEEEINDCQFTLKQDEEALSQAKHNVDRSKVALAEAIIKLYKYEQ